MSLNLEHIMVLWSRLRGEQDKSDGILLKPWIGNNYGKQGSKILVVGESHYEDASFIPYEEYTCKVVKSISDGTKHRYFTNAFTSLKDLVGGDDIEAFLSRIAFCNYIQHILPFHNDTIFNYYIHNEKYRKHFCNIVQSIKPEIVVLTSYRLDSLWAYCGIKEWLKNHGVEYTVIRHLSRRPLNEDEKKELREYL